MNLSYIFFGILCIIIILFIIPTNFHKRMKNTVLAKVNTISSILQTKKYTPPVLRTTNISSLVNNTILSTLKIPPIQKQISDMATSIPNNIPENFDINIGTILCNDIPNAPYNQNLIHTLLNYLADPAFYFIFTPQFVITDEGQSVSIIKYIQSLIDPWNSLLSTIETNFTPNKTNYSHFIYRILGTNFEYSLLLQILILAKRKSNADITHLNTFLSLVLISNINMSSGSNVCYYDPATNLIYFHKNVGITSPSIISVLNGKSPSEWARYFIDAQKQLYSQMNNSFIDKNGHFLENSIRPPDGYVDLVIQFGTDPSYMNVFNTDNSCTPISSFNISNITTLV